MFERTKAIFKALAGSAPAAAPKKSASKAGQLPPVEEGKTPNKQQGIPGYLNTTQASTSALQKTDLRTANIDLVSAYRGGDTQTLLRNYTRVHPDMSAARAAYLRVGIPEDYYCLALDPDGTVNDDATRLAFEILQRFDKLDDYKSGFTATSSIRSVSESLAVELFTYGAASMELVLDKARIPYKFQPVSVTKLKWYEDNSGGNRALRPVQDVGGTEIDLDIPTFFYIALDPSLLEAYAQSPVEAAIQPILASQQFMNDLRRICARHVYPRYDVLINEENFRASLSESELLDPVKRSQKMQSAIEEVAGMINNLSVEDAMIHWDFVQVKFVEGQAESLPDIFSKLDDLLNAKVATGAKVMPSMLGHGDGSQNLASTETMTFMMSANGMIRLKLMELYSKGMTLAVRLLGYDVTVSFKFAPIDLRPDSELEAFKVMREERLRQQLSMGLLSDMEYALITTGKPYPSSYELKSGTGFMDASKVSDPNATNGYSGTGAAGGGQGGGGALNQSLKPKTPQKAKGPQK